MTVDPDRWMKYPVPEPLPETLDGLDWETRYAVQERWKRLAAAETPEKMPFTNLDLFVKDVADNVSPHVVEFRPYEVRVANYRWLGCAFLKTLAEFKATANDWRVEVPVKTGRAPSGFDCDGTEPPTMKAMAAVERVAARWGLGEPRWEPCEKGWGSFVMKVTPSTTLVSLLRSMALGEKHEWALPSGTRVKVYRSPAGWQLKPPQKGVRVTYPTPTELADRLYRGDL
jgi:hypothetical protein